jgi:hypothetical protein
LHPWYDRGGDRKDRQGGNRKVYDTSAPSVRQSKQSKSKGNLAQGNGNRINREFRGAKVHQDVEITQIDWGKG